MTWITEHLLGLFGGGAASILGHVGTAAFGWLKERAKAGELAEIEQVSAQKASYRVGDDWEHLVLALVTIGLMVWAAATGQPDQLQEVTRGMALASIAWYTGRLTFRGLA